MQFWRNAQVNGRVYLYIRKSCGIVAASGRKKQNQHFRQKSARDFVHGIERRSCDIPKRDIINIPVWYAHVKRWAYEIKGAERKTGDIPAEACNGPGAESEQHKQVRIRREGGGLQDADRAGRLF